jgi:centractin
MVCPHKAVTLIFTSLVQVLITEAPFTPASQREALAQLMFERLRVPSLHFASTPTLALYGSGRTTGLVLDCGDGVTSATPIYEGFSISEASVRSDLGGRDVTIALQKQLRKAGHVFNTSAELEMLASLKETACYVAKNPQAEEAAIRKEKLAAASSGASGGSATTASSSSLAPASPSEETYILPDGSRIRMGIERFAASEVLFNPSLVGGLETPACHEAIAMAISKSELELRPALLSSIVLAGGTTATKGFGERLLAEVKRSLPPDAKVKLWAPAERKIITWVGGSILASLSTFKGMCVRREEWEDVGAAVFSRNRG